MRDGAQLRGARAPLAKGLRALALSITTCCGLGVAGAQAQQPQYPPQAVQQDSPTVAELMSRLDAQQTKMDQLQAQVSGMQTAASSGQLQATPVSMETATANTEMADGPQLPPGATIVATNDKVPLNAYWNNGVWLSSANEDFKVHFGGRIQFDAFNDFDAQHTVEFGKGGLGDFAVSQGFRRDRVRMEGTIYDSVDFVWEYDFATAMNPKNFQTVAGGPAGSAVLANGSSVFTGTGITDMNVTLKYIPVIGNFTVGSFLVPFSFELATSDRWMDFIERSAAFDSFVPATNFANYTLGARINNWNESETLTYAASLSTNNMWDGASGFDFGNDYMVAGRATALPLYCDDGRYMVEVGLSGCSEECQHDPLVAGNPNATQLRSRLATREYLSPLTQSIVSTGVIDGKIQDTVGAEYVQQWGPLSIESEYYGSWITDDNGTGGAGTETLFFKGMYVQASYFLTGENRNYNRQRANYERVVPYENYFRVPGDYNTCTGRGAWQVCARYSYVDLNDLGVHGGDDNEFTAGLNWFLNPNLKLQFNYDYTFRNLDQTTNGNNASTGYINGFGTRMCLDF